MINPINRIKNKNKSFKEKDLIQIRHDMMKCYGWIPIEEFRKIKIPELLDLNELVQKEREREYKKYVAIMRFAGVKKSDI